MVGAIANARPAGVQQLMAVGDVPPYESIKPKHVGWAAGAAAAVIARTFLERGRLLSALAGAGIGYYIFKQLSNGEKQAAGG